MIEKCCKYCGTKENLFTFKRKKDSIYCILDVCARCRSKNLREKNLGKKLSEQEKNRLRNLQLGKKQSLETIEKRCQKLRGRKYTKEHCTAISKSLIGRKLSEEHKKAVSLGQIGHKQSPETIEKRVSKLRGKKHPPRPEGFGERQSIITKEKMNVPGMFEKLSAAQKKSFNDMPERRERMRVVARESYHTKRKTGTDIERVMMELLNKKNVNYVHNHLMRCIKDQYNVDFFLPEHNLVIECDGEIWHNYPVGRPIDHIRETQLKEKGYRILRFWGNEINKHIDFVEYCIDKYINQEKDNLKISI